MRSSDVEDGLRAYFGGEFAGRMGLRSWCGPMLEHAASAALHPINRSMQYMPVAPIDQSAQRANHEIGEGAVEAVRAEARIRAALRQLDDASVIVLRRAFEPAPRGVSRLLIHLVGTERLHALCVAIAGEDREARRAAKKHLALAQASADKVLDEAKVAYRAAISSVDALDREARANRFRRLLGAA